MKIETIAEIFAKYYPVEMLNGCVLADVIKMIEGTEEWRDVKNRANSNREHCQLGDC